jgi:hypothetical protein
VRLPDEPFWWRGLLFHVCVFIAAAMGVIFYTGLVLRRRVTDNVIGRSGSGRLRELLGGEFAAYSRLRDLPRLSMGILLSGFALATACIVFVILDPVTFGWLLGSAAMPFLGFALIVPVGSLAVYLCHVAVARGRRQVGAKQFSVVEHPCSHGLPLSMRLPSREVTRTGRCAGNRTSSKTTAHIVP